MVDSQPGNKLIAYIKAECLPKVIAGFRKLGENHNEISVMEELKKYCPVFHTYKMMDGNLLPITRDFEELNHFERRRLVDEIIIFAANDLDIKIENPK